MVFFSKNYLRWPISFLKWPVWPASSDWRLRVPVLFCPVMNNASFEHTKLASPDSWCLEYDIEDFIVPCITLQVISEWSHLPTQLHRSGNFIFLTSPSQKSNSLTLLLNCCCWLDSFRCWLFSLDFCTKYSHCCWSLVILSLTISSLPAHFRCSIRPA